MAIDTLRATYNIRQILEVADSGMLNGDNIALFDKGNTSEGFEFIVGDRLKSMSGPTIKQLTILTDHTNVIIKDKKA